MKDQAAELAEEAVCLLMKHDCFSPTATCERIGWFRDAYATKVREELNDQAKPPSRLVEDVIVLKSQNDQLRNILSSKDAKVAHLEAHNEAMAKANKDLTINRNYLLQKLEMLRAKLRELSLS